MDKMIIFKGCNCCPCGQMSFVILRLCIFCSLWLYAKLWPFVLIVRSSSHNRIHIQSFKFQSVGLQHFRHNRCQIKCGVRGIVIPISIRIRIQIQIHSAMLLWSVLPALGKCDLYAALCKNVSNNSGSRAQINSSTKLGPFPARKSRRVP